MIKINKTLLIIYFILMNVVISISAIITHTYIFIKIQIIIQFSYYVMSIWLFRILHISYYNIINIIKYDRHSLAWGYERFINPYSNISMGIQMGIKEDKNGRYVEVNKEKFYLGDTLDETIDDVLSLINNLRQAEKTATKYEDDELLEVIRKKIAYYSTVLKEIYSDD